MTDIFPKLYATSKAMTYFATTLVGFKDSADRFKFFEGDESPTTETPFISCDITFGGQEQQTDWSTPTVTFNVTGKDTDAALLMTIANEIRDYYIANTKFSDGTQYQTIGQAVFGQGRNPVTEHKVVSVALQFGLV